MNAERESVRRSGFRPPRIRTVLTLAVISLVVPISMAPAQPGGENPCLGAFPGAHVANRDGRPLRFGITPAGEAGQLGPPAKAVPEHPERTLAALDRLRPRDRSIPFVVRLNRLFWSSGEGGLARFLATTRRYTRQGYQVEVQLRYHPAPSREGDVFGFARWVRRVVDLFGPNPQVVGLQVTNEANFTYAPDSSDGAYQGARDALVQGVLAARDEVERTGHDQLKIGFSWFYRTDPANEGDYWEYLRTKGGPAFADAVDWVGLDAYPGTFFPPITSPGGERDAMLNAISVLRECFLPLAGIGRDVPIHVEENGFPTGAARSYGRQRDSLSRMVHAVDEYGPSYNVTDYRWFDLRDANTGSANFQQHYGLLEDDYTPKPAFGFQYVLSCLNVVS